MKLVKGDGIWAGVLVLIAAFLAVPQGRELFLAATRAHPYFMGFIKVGILATMGELLALRIAHGKYRAPVGLPWRSLIWGCFGITFALVFDVFAMGVHGAISKGLLPGAGSRLASAFFTSALMNLAFAPTFMALHRITDTWIELGSGTWKGMRQVRLVQVAQAIDWYGYLSFVVARTIPLFWIPAHTITFLLPQEYRVLMAAMLSIVLGALLSFSRSRKRA